MGLGDMFKKYTSTGRKLGKKQRSFEKARAHAELADMESNIAFREREDPREQAQLKGSLFGRGLGKSSIATQNTARLTDIQARRMAVMKRQRDLHLKGISLIKLRAKALRRFMPFDVADDLINVTAAIATGGASIPFSAAAEAVGDRMDPANANQYFLE